MKSTVGQKESSISNGMHVPGNSQCSHIYRTRAVTKSSDHEPNPALTGSSAFHLLTQIFQLERLISKGMKQLGMSVA